MLSESWTITNAPPRVRTAAVTTPPTPSKWLVSSFDTFAAAWCVMAQCALEPFVVGQERSGWQSRINLARKHLPEDNVPDAIHCVRVVRLRDTNRRIERHLMQSGAGFSLVIPTKLDDRCLSATELLAVWTDVAVALVAGASAAAQRAAVSTLAFTVPPTEDGSRPGTVIIDVIPSGTAHGPDLEAEVISWLPASLQKVLTVAPVQLLHRQPSAADSLGASVSSLRSEGAPGDVLPPSMAAAPVLAAPPSKASKKGRRDDDKTPAGSSVELPSAPSSVASTATSAAASTNPGAASTNSASASNAAAAAATFLRDAEAKAKEIDKACATLIEERAAFDKILEEVSGGKDGAANVLLAAQLVDELLAPPHLSTFMALSHTPNFSASTPKLAKLAASGGDAARRDLSASQEKQLVLFGEALRFQRARNVLARAAVLFIRERREIESSGVQRIASIIGNMKKQAPPHPPTPSPHAAALPSSPSPPLPSSAATTEVSDAAAPDVPHDADAPVSCTSGDEVGRNSPSVTAAPAQPVAEAGRAKAAASTASAPSRRQPKGGASAASASSGASPKPKQTKAASPTAASGAVRPRAQPFWRDNDRLFLVGVISFAVVLLGVLAAAVWG